MSPKHLAWAWSGLSAGVCLYAAAAPIQISVSIAGWVLVAICLAALLGAERRWPDIRLGGVEKLLLAYFALGVLGALAGVSLPKSLPRLHSDATLILVAFLFAAAFRLKPVPEALHAAAAGFGLAALLGIGQITYRYFAEGQVFMARGLVHHITYGEMMALGATGALAALVFSQGASARRRLALAALGTATTAALLLSQARGPWLGFALSVATIALLRREARALLLAGAAAILLALAATPMIGSAVHERFLSIFDPTQNANAVRLQLWQYAIRDFREYPLLGSGPGTFGLMLERYHPQPLQAGIRFTQTHNMYLHLLAERGVLGLALWLTLLGTLWWTAVQRYRRRPDLQSLWLVAALTGFWVMNLTQNTYQTAMVATFVWFLWVYTMRSERAA